jgi:peptidoglycan hydrolase CwlO-like protein
MTVTNMIEQIIMTIVTTLIGYFVGKRKTNADTDNQILRNLELSIGIYTKIIEDLKSEIHQLNIKVQDLEKMVDTLMKENKKLKYNITDLKNYK